jgi:16S rRNA (cytidine1402-2'-O)-methyltransferase
LCIACNISATDELIQTKTIKDWAKQKIDLHKKPTIFILGV